MRCRIDLLAPPFSGHLNPILAIGRVLASDYRVRVISTASVKEHIQAAGLEPVTVLRGCDAALQEIASPPHAVGGNPLRLHRQFSKALRLLQVLKTELLDLYRNDRPDLLIADFTLATAGVAADELGIAWWTSLPSPCVLESKDAPPAYLGGWLPRNDLLGTIRNATGRKCVRTFKRTLSWLYRRPISHAGLKSLYREDESESIYSRDCILVLGLPELEFAQEWPAAARLIGPMLYTPTCTAPTPPFITGRRHVLVTMGTHLDWIKERAVNEVRRVAAALPSVEFHFSDGRQGDMSTESDGNFSRIPFVDYHRFISRYDVVVHHGGSGVLYYCLREGRRSVVCPADYDQFDNAARLEYAGVARRIDRLDGMEVALRRTLTDEAMAARCAKFAGLIQTRHGEQILRAQVMNFFGRDL